MKKMTSFYSTICLTALILFGFQQSRIHAAFELQNICSVGGQSEVQLSGFGLVIGLNGTGDGGKLPPTAKALMAAIEKMHGPSISDLAELKNAKNVALVSVQVVVPKSGVLKGQNLDCFITSVGAAKSLRGGRLMWTPLQQMGVRNDKVRGPLMVAVATGPVNIEDEKTPTSAFVPKGVTLKMNIQHPFVDDQGYFTLLIKPSQAIFQVATEIADAINDSQYNETSFKMGYGENIAKALGPGIIRVKMPESKRKDPVSFVSDILELPIDDPHRKAIVVVNAKTGVVLISGEVEISPISFSHKTISVSVAKGDDDGFAQGFVGTVPSLNRANPDDIKKSPELGKLSDLQEVLKDLQVDEKDLIDILRTIDATGKLHAEFIEQ